MKKILFPLVLLLTGGAVGAAAAMRRISCWAVRPSFGESEGGGTEEPGTFVELPRMTAPLVLKDGKLSGYAAFEVQLEVGEDDVDVVTARLPYLQHAINLRTFRIPLAAGADGMLPDLDSFRRIVIEAAREAIGPGKVRKVAVTKAEPA